MNRRDLIAGVASCFGIWALSEAPGGSGEFPCQPTVIPANTHQHSTIETMVRRLPTASEIGWNDCCRLNREHLCFRAALYAILTGTKIDSATYSLMISDGQALHTLVAHYSENRSADERFMALGDGVREKQLDYFTSGLSTEESRQRAAHWFRPENGVPVAVLPIGEPNLNFNQWPEYCITTIVKG